MQVSRFLGMVGALIWCPSTRKYLLLKRSADKDFAGETWECGTGRVDQGENFSEALRREINEEMGIEITVDFIIGTAHFFRGQPTPENEMLGVFYRCSLDDPESIQVSWEHSEYRWLDPDEVFEMLPEDHWLVNLVQRAEVIRSMMPSDLIRYFHQVGFEL